MSDPRIWVLVMEDDRISLRLIAHQVRKRGFDVIVAENGVQVLDIIKYCTPDCILLDILMPKMHGHKFLSQLRQRSKSLPVVIMGSIEKRCDLVETFDHLGIEWWFSKPINPDRITKRIKEIVDPNS